MMVGKMQKVGTSEGEQLAEKGRNVPSAVKGMRVLTSAVAEAR